MTECFCEELIIREYGEDNNPTGAFERLRTPKEHSCEYVAKRTALVEEAWRTSGMIARNDDERTAIFHYTMERMVADLYIRGEI